MTSNQATTATDEDPDAPAPGAEEFEYALPGTEKILHLKRPTDEQLTVLLRLQSMLEDMPLNGVQLYLDLLGALMRPDEEQWCLRAMLRGALKLEAFTETARATLYHFHPELEQAAKEAERTSRTHGPAATRRPKRR